MFLSKILDFPIFGTTFMRRGSDKNWALGGRVRSKLNFGGSDETKTGILEIGTGPKMGFKGSDGTKTGF